MSGMPLPASPEACETWDVGREESLLLFVLMMNVLKLLKQKVLHISKSLLRCFAPIYG